MLILAVGGCVGETFDLEGRTCVEGAKGTDLGACCEVSEGRSPMLIPTSIDADGQPIQEADLDPAFLCSNFTCVAHDGVTAYCTQSCDEMRPCPDGFTCRGGFSGNTTGMFCVAARHECTLCD